MKIDGVAVRRSFLEVPTMDERKWAKIPGIHADVFMADMEDSVPPKLKEAARDKVVALVKDPTFFDTREFICRPNNLATPWGPEDLEALAEAGAPLVLYPKVRSAAEVDQVLGVFAKHQSVTELHLIIETPQAVMDLAQIAKIGGVHGLMLGPGDLALESGMSLFDGDDPFDEGFLYARSKLQTVGKAVGLEITEGLLVADLKNEPAVRKATHQSKLRGYSGNLTFYPPHIEWINAERTPKAQDVAWASKAVEAFQEAQEAGVGAVTVDGRWVTVHQFHEAKQTLQVAETLGI